MAPFRIPGEKEIFFYTRHSLLVSKRSYPVGVSGRFSFFTRSLVAFPKVTAFVDFGKALKQAGL
jgi:hypothetical protein